MLYCLHSYKGDEKIKSFAWDLITPLDESIKSQSELDANFSTRGRKPKTAPILSKKSISEEIADAQWPKEAKHDPEIHGVDGLGGVKGLPHITDPDPLLVKRRELSQGLRAIDGIARCIQSSWRDGEEGGSKVTVISSGPMTNIALFVSVYPDLLQGVEQFVFMGGGVGMGNRSAVAGTLFAGEGINV